MCEYQNYADDGEYMFNPSDVFFPSDPDAPREPERDDLITPDGRRFYTIGRSYVYPTFFTATPDFVIPDGEPVETYLDRYCEARHYFPLIWSVSEEGRLSLYYYDRSI